MAAVNRIPGKQLMLYIWDKSASVPAWRPIGCLESNDFNTSLTSNDVEAIYTKCGIIPAQQNITGLTFQFSGNGFAVDSTSTGSPDLDKASHDVLLAAQKAERETGLADDWKLVSMETPGIGDQFGKGIISDLSKGGDAAPDAFQNFTFTVTGVPDTLSDTTTVDEEG